jgi:hypothetical protein
LATYSIYKIDSHRRLCIKKDLEELSFWITALEYFNTELDYLSALEKQIIHNPSVSNEIQGLRRKNVLHMATFCKYEQELKIEYEYGKTEYDDKRVKIHEKKRERYLQLTQEYNRFKHHCYRLMLKYQRK